jgi:hypothetical protein
MMRFVHQGIGVQSRVNHDSVYEVIHHGSDAVVATKSAVERAFLLAASWISSRLSTLPDQNGVRGSRPSAVTLC